MSSIEIDAYDEMQYRYRYQGHCAAHPKAGGGFVALVGVQSNRISRALDLTRIFRKHNILRRHRWFHVSGVISMLPTLTPELQEALDLGARPSMPAKAKAGWPISCRDMASVRPSRSITI